ncbi:MAG TPA: NYN domain-containing protein [Candidatus Paceibacterota bacterium]
MANYAFIDSQNLNLGVRQQGWKIDFHKFRIYLTDKYQVAKAFLFIGYVEQDVGLYDYLREAGFVCIFKPVLFADGKIKGNVDAELVLHAMITLYYFTKAVSVTGDGDFYCLAEYLQSGGKLEILLVPDGKNTLLCTKEKRLETRCVSSMT